MSQDRKQRFTKRHRFGLAGSARPERTPSRATVSARRLLRRHPVLRFVLTFSTLASAFYAVTLFLPFYREHLFPACLRLTARSSGVVLTALGQDIAVADTSISTPHFAAQIVRGCDAVEPVALFVCAVLAFPAPFMKRVCGLIAGTLTLASLNCVRIVSLFLIGVYVPGLLHVMHVDVWQSLFIILALVLWILWLLWATQGQTTAKATSG